MRKSSRMSAEALTDKLRWAARVHVRWGLFKIHMWALCWCKTPTKLKYTSFVNNMEANAMDTMTCLQHFVGRTMWQTPSWLVISHVLMTGRMEDGMRSFGFLWLSSRQRGERKTHLLGLENSYLNSYLRTRTWTVFLPDVRPFHHWQGSFAFDSFLLSLNNLAHVTFWPYFRILCDVEHACASIIPGTSPQVQAP